MNDVSKSTFVHDQSPQGFFDSFNSFIMSSDTKVFNKLMSKHFFLDMTKGIPGDVLELGVFRGSGVFSWLKMLSFLNVKKCVYGFDIFDSELLISVIGTKDKDVMLSLFQDRGFSPLGYQDILHNRLVESGFLNFELIAGDIFNTLPVFLQKNPGFRASLINFDLDTEEPTYFALEQLWDRLVVGGMLVFDEYAINEWTESDAVDRFISEKNLQLKSTNLVSPSAYIIK